jgi:rhodanese-related sulfurtransferase
MVYVLRERSQSGTPITTNELTALVNRDAAVIVDIRPSVEFKLGHLVDSLNIPYERIVSESGLLEKHRTKMIIVVDKMGQYSGMAGRQLIKQGYEVRRLSGGISEWQTQNLPLVKHKQK